LVVDVEVGWLRGDEVRRLPLGESLSDLVAAVCVVDEPLFADFIFFRLAFFVLIFALVTYCDVVPSTVWEGELFSSPS
jgi:hypothetical protein